MQIENSIEKQKKIKQEQEKIKAELAERKFKKRQKEIAEELEKKKLAKIELDLQKQA